MSKRNQKRWVRNRVLRMEELEPVICLSLWGWATNTFNTYIVPVANTIVDAGKTVVETTVKVVDTFVDEVDEHFIEPVVKVARDIDRHIDEAADAVLDQVGSGIDVGVKIVSDLIGTGETLAANFEKSIDSAMESVPGGVVVSTTLDVAAGIYDSAKRLVTDVAGLAADGYYVTVGQVTNPEKAKEVVDKWHTVFDKVKENPAVIVTSIIDSYAREKNVGRIFGRVGFDAITLVVGAGEVSSVIKATKAIKAVDAIVDVSKVAKVSKVPSKLAKVVDVVDEIAADIAKTPRRSTTVMADTGRKVGSSYSSKATKVLDNVLPAQPGVWNLETASVEIETGAKEMSKVTIRERLDFSGTTHSKKSTKGVDPEIQVEVIDTTTTKILKHDVVKEQLPGFNGMGYGGRRSTTVSSVTMSTRK